MQKSALDLACDLAERFEGFSPTPYQDAGGVWTIGYGTVFIPGIGERVTKNTPPITQETARKWLCDAMQVALDSVDNLVKVPLNDNQRAALADFVYNLGAESLARSTLLKIINNGLKNPHDLALCAIQFERWVHDASGEVLPGLVARRKAEAELFCKAVDSPIIINHANMKLGRIPAKQNPLLPPANRYFAINRPVPSSIDWFSKVTSWPMLANDHVGDCTVAAVGHVIQQWTTYTDQTPVVMSDAEVLQAYSTITGYVPGQPNTDRGALCSDVLKYWMTAGMPTPGGGPDTLTAAAGINAQDRNAISYAIATFGNVYAGLALPLSAQTEVVWASTEQEPGTWGGHCVPLVGYNETGPICVTWGSLKQMTWSWWLRYAEESYALLSPDWLKSNGIDPNGVNWDQLKADLQAFLS